MEAVDPFALPLPAHLTQLQIHLLSFCWVQRGTGSLLETWVPGTGRKNRVLVHRSMGQTPRDHSSDREGAGIWGWLSIRSRLQHCRSFHKDWERGQYSWIYYKSHRSLLCLLTRMSSHTQYLKHFKTNHRSNTCHFSEFEGRLLMKINFPKPFTIQILLWGALPKAPYEHKLMDSISINCSKKMGIKRSSS